MIRSVAGRSVAMDPSLVTGQKPVERPHEIHVRAGAELQDDDPGRGVRNEDGQQAVLLSGDEPSAGIRQVEDAAPIAGLDRELGGLHARKTTGLRTYGKKLRMASRSREGRPFAGADS